MARIWVSFKNTEEEQKLLEFLNKKSVILGNSAYIKQLLYEQKLKEEEGKK